MARSATLRKVSRDATVTTWAGQPEHGYHNGTGRDALFFEPRGIAVDRAGNVFVADRWNNAIRRVTPDGRVTTVMVFIGQPGVRDQPGNRGLLSYPHAVAVDWEGTLYVATETRVFRGVPSSGVWPPRVVAHRSRIEDSGAVFQVSADGEGETYQWTKDGVSIPGATGPTYTVPVHRANAGTYRARAINERGSGESEPFILGVAPRIYNIGSQQTFQPVSSDIVLPVGATFAVQAWVNSWLHENLTRNYQWRKNGVPIPGATNAVFEVPTASAGDGGRYDVTVANVFGGDTSRSFIVRVVGGLAVNGSSQHQAVLAGQTVVLSADVEPATELSFQWMKDGTAIPGATARTLTIASAQLADRGSYAVSISGRSIGTLVRDGLNLVVEPTVRIANFSTRVEASAGQAVILGVGVRGSGEAPLLLRGIGPGLATFVPGIAVVADPQLEVFSAGGVRVGVNDDWAGTTQLVAAFERAGAFPLAGDSRDAALLSNARGPLTTHLSARTAGAALLEVYDLGDVAYDPNQSGRPTRLANVSLRHAVSSTRGGLVAGFVVDGVGELTLLIRGVGPSLTAFGIAGVLNNPKIEVFNAQGKSMAENDDWPVAAGEAFARAAAFPLPTGSKDAALLMTLPAGAYTALLSAAGNDAGEALLEIYVLP